MSNKIGNLLKIPSIKSFLYFELEGEKIKETNNYFKPKFTIVKMKNHFKSIKEMNKSGIKIYVNDIDYDDVLYDDSGKIELIYEAPDKNFTKSIGVNNIEFDKKEGDFYIFYISVEPSDVKEFFNNIIDSATNNEKIDLIKRAEADEL